MVLNPSGSRHAVFLCDFLGPVGFRGRHTRADILIALQHDIFTATLTNSACAVDVGSVCGKAFTRSNIWTVVLILLSLRIIMIFWISGLSVY